MPAPVPAAPTPSELRSQLVAAPVSATSCGRVWSAQLAFLLGRALPAVASLRLHAITPRTTATVSVPLQWRPSPGCRLALVTVDLNTSDIANLIGRSVAVGRNSLVSLTVPAGAGVIASSLLGASGPLDGSTPLQQQDPWRVARQQYAALVHLGAAGSVADIINDITVTLAASGTHDHAGFAQVSLVELPAGTLQPETGEVGLLTPAIDPRNDLHDGDSSIGTGWPEILEAEQDASTRQREHFQIATYEDTTRCWTRASAVMGSINFVGSAGTSDPWFRVRVRATQGTSAGTPASFILRVRHNSLDDWDLKITKRVVGSGATSTHTENIASSGGAWAAYESAGAITLRADGTDQEIDLKFEASILSGTLYLSAIALIQTETP